MAKAKFETVEVEAETVKEETTAVAVKETTAVSTGVEVKGLNIRFATLSPFYAVSAVPQECAQECREGDLYLKTGKTSAWRLAGSGKANGVRAIVVDGKEGFLEGCPMGTGMMPRTWVVGRPKSAGSPEVIRTVEEARAAALAETEGKVPFYRFEDYSKAMNPVPQHYIAPCIYLELLVQVPDTFAGDVTLVKVGGSLYTPARLLFKKFDTIKVRQFFNNIRVRESMRHRGEKGWEWSPYGQYVTVFTQGAEFTRPTGQKGYIWTPTVEATLNTQKDVEECNDGRKAGMLYAPTDEERRDLEMFYMAVASTPATAEDVASAGQDGEL